ncbi:MAG TPA: head GIN domain-containing protein [Chitinophagaceae bacterium]|nr:head GIN domain-containing protein [Chitinophagaceae bacterium]
MKKNHCFMGALFLLVVGAGSCVLTGKRVVGNGQVTTQERQAGDFETLALAGSMQVYLTQGTVEAARIEAESNLLPYIATEKRGDELRITFKDHVNIEAHKPIKIYLTAPGVTHLSVMGSGNITVSDTLRTDEAVKLNIAGSGNIVMQMNAPELDANIAGSGDILLGGETRNTTVNIVGSGNFKGSHLKSEQSRIKIAGSGNVRVYASIKLHATILGSGNVYYEGSPSVETTMTGSGKVIKQP